MIKSLFVLFGYIAFLLIGVFSGDTVLIENNTPAMIASGTRTLVEVNVRKGEVQGFSKLELVLPAGFTATPGDIKGASFTFSGDRAKFVWMNLPEESVFKVSYYIESEAEIEGAYEIKGTFSYVRENIREDIYVPTRTVVVKQQVDMPQPAAAQAPQPLRVEESLVEMTCERRIERVGDNEYRVRLTVNNSRIVGFGKILEILPDNCSTNRDNDGGAVITQDARSIKFVWFEVPTASSFEVSYRVMCISDGTVPAIRGQLSFTENGSPFMVDVVQVEAPADLASVDSSGGNSQQNTSGNSTTDTTTQNTTNGNSADMNSGQNNQSTVDTNTNTAQNQDSNTNQQPVNSEGNTTDFNNQANVSSSTENTGSSVLAIPSAEKGVTYKVQILAAHRVVDKTYFSSNFSFEQDYNIEHHNGWVKYTTGMYAQYKDARDARVRITSESSKLPGPFVTAYNDGERITVQEALLISKQLWYK
jgi:hypothetical protein